MNDRNCIYNFNGIKIYRNGSILINDSTWISKWDSFKLCNELSIVFNNLGYNDFTLDDLFEENAKLLESIDEYKYDIHGLEDDKLELKYQVEDLEYTCKDLRKELNELYEYIASLKDNCESLLNDR